MGGDEPYMLASNLPNVCVLVDKDRVKSGRYAIQKLGCDTLILDDGFQYLRLKHRVDIVLVDRTNPFDNGYVLPRGLLRESTRHLSRATFIFITKSTGDGSAELRQQIRALNDKAEIAECRHTPRHFQDVFTGENASPSTSCAAGRSPPSPASPPRAASRKPSSGSAANWSTASGLPTTIATRSRKSST